MSTESAFGLVGALMQALLAVLYLRVWRSLGFAWACQFAIGLLCASVVFGAFAWRQPQIGPAHVPPLPMKALLGLAYIFLTAGLLGCLGHSHRVKVWTIGGLLAIWLVSNAIGPTHEVGAVMASLLNIGWALLVVDAMRRQRRYGDALVALTLFSLPLLIVTSNLGWTKPSMAVPWHGLAIAFLGITVLCLGLLGESRRARAAQARSESAEAAVRAANDHLVH